MSEITTVQQEQQPIQHKRSALKLNSLPYVCVYIEDKVSIKYIYMVYLYVMVQVKVCAWI